MTRETVQLQSTALRSASYDDELQQMEITFASGTSYTLERVPREVFEELRDSPSPGTYFHQSIKGQY